MIPYKHTVQYYETDKMGITHHSNYIRWMEEARIDFLNQLGWGFEKLEAMGMVSPIISVEGKYKKSTYFPEVISIIVKVTEFKGVKLKLDYIMTNSDDEVVFTGHSEHCFLDTTGRPIKMSREYPEFNDILVKKAEG